MNTKTDNTANLEKILDNFKIYNESQELGNTEQYLIEAFNSDSNICLICIETIEPTNAIWNCEGCYQPFHIRCIQNWIKDGSYLAVVNSQNVLPDTKTIPWNCPKCRKDYAQSNYPSAYHCYCKKVKDPTYDPWTIPHSCNQKCGKVKPCKHTCLLLCHPGPCPPCPKIVNESCYCSKSSPIPRRCSNKNWSCEKKCNKLLQCKQHLCSENCHPNKCLPCEKRSIQFCTCKKKRKEVSCQDILWKCEEVCNKMYSCTYHKCEIVCHENGKCGECPRSLLRSCPCGKSKFQKPCVEEIVTCGDTCDKKLDCNIHKCTLRCHFGQCEQCRYIISKKCRCGRMEKSVPCSSEFLCEYKCNKMKSCGKHKCNKKCCDGSCGTCDHQCNKLLSCRNHKCLNNCHQGQCYPCTILVELRCPCGQSSLKVPCVKSKSNIQVPCKNLCNLPAKCHHDKIQKHKCHYNECPPCSLKCDKLMDCSHNCQSKCHSAVLTEVVENKDRDGPWVALNVKKVLMNLKCGDCNELVAINCLGKHEIGSLPCYRAKPYNCGRKCGQLLKCTNHTCELECHNLQNQDLDNTDCEQCERPCEQQRLKGCEHDCPLSWCHPGKCPDCIKLIKMKCHCKNNFVYVECFKWNMASNEEKISLQSCKVPCSKTINCPNRHQCEITCHAGPCLDEKNCLNKVNLKCSCKTLKKSLLCNQFKSESNSIEFSKKENKYYLICNEICKQKKLQKNKLEENDTTQETAATSKHNESNLKTSFKYIMFALLILIISIILYIYLSLL